jgi:hypothetical protein
MVHEIRIRYGGAALLSLLVLMMALACGDDPYTPDNPDVVAELYKLYPNARNISWSKKGDYFVADCWDGNNELDVWITDDAQWLMTEVAIFRSQLPASVNTAFTESDYADWTIKDLTLQTYPSAPGEIYVIEVEDSDKIVILYYSEYGSLMHSRDVANGDTTHWPSIG